MRFSPAALATTSAQKNCDCCSELTPEELAASREHLASVQKQRLAYQKVYELIQQYGLKEGLRRLKQSYPEIAERFEHFTENYAVAEEH